ncbi:MAG: SufD family Fe-S cluster assembly protein [bacterium]
MSFIYLNKNKKKNYLFEKPGKYTVFFSNISGDYKFFIKSKGVDLEILGIIIGKDKKSFNINTNQVHIAPKSTSNLLVKAILYDKSRFQFKGLIKIEKTGQKTKAYQKNQNLLMSKDSFIDTKPYLEILADDVYCTHGSTTGKIDKETMFYLNSRNIEQNEAENLVVKGFLNEIFDKIKISASKNEFDQIQKDIINKI